MPTEPASLPPIQEPPEQAAQMNTQTLMILVGVLVVVGLFVGYVAKAIAPGTRAAEPLGTELSTMMPSLGIDPANEPVVIEPPTEEAPTDPTPPATDPPATDPQE